MYICSTNSAKPVYVPALERWSHYKSIWQNHWEEFGRMYDQKFLSIYGELTKDKIEKVEKLLKCGNSFNVQPQNCPDCGKEMQLSLVYSYSAKKSIEKLRATHIFINGYFRPIIRPP